VFYNATNLPDGVYYVTATCEGFVNYNETITLTEGERMQFEVVLVRDMPLTTFFKFQLNNSQKAYSLQFYTCGDTAFSYETKLDQSAMYRTYSTIRLDILDDEGNTIYIITTNEIMAVLVID